jgi:hypothetical protein
MYLKSSQSIEISPLCRTLNHSFGDMNSNNVEFKIEKEIEKIFEIKSFTHLVTIPQAGYKKIKVEESRCSQSAMRCLFEIN